MPATFVWTGAQDTNFDNAENWNDVTDGLNPATTAPGAQDTAEFIMGGGTITGTGMVAGLLFGGTDPWVLSNGAQLTDTASFTDSGTLTIQSGARITSSGNSATTTINSGSASSTATLHVDGAGSSFAVTSGFAALTIGSQLLATDPTGIGSLVVTNGGAARIAGHVFIGSAPDNSSIQVDGSSSVEIGTAGDGADGAITVDAYPGTGGIHTLEGCGTIIANLVNNYYVAAEPRAVGAPLEITGEVTASAASEINIPGGILQLDAPSPDKRSNSPDLPLPVTMPTLRLLDPADFHGTLSDFAAVGDTLELVGQTVTDASRSGATMTVSLLQGGPLTFDLAGAGPASLGFSGSDISVVPATLPCFRGGTLIATPMGDVAVEQLREGDAVMVARGGTERVVWIGHRRVDCSHRRDPQQVWPVRVTADAFGPAQPRRDLWLSPDHAVVLVRACSSPSSTSSTAARSRRCRWTS